MLKQIEFLKELIALSIFFHDYDREMVRVGIGNEEIRRVYEQFPEIRPYLERLNAESEKFINKLRMLQCFLRLPDEQRIEKFGVIHELKSNLKIEDEIRVFLSVVLEDHFRILEQFCVLYQRDFPDKFSTIKGYASHFQNLTIKRFNLHSSVESLRTLDESKPEDLKKMLSILEDASLN